SIPGPSVFRGMGDLSVDAGQRTEIAVSSEAFTHPQSDAVISLAARLANGGTLPAWVRFDANRGTFVVTAPPGMRGTLEIVLIARDQTGREATTTFKLRIDAPPEAAAGRAGLSEQLRAAGQRPGALSALLRPASPAERPTPTSTDTGAGGQPTPRPAVQARTPTEAAPPARQAPVESVRPGPSTDRPADRPSFAAKQRPQR
ncbi:MAG: putative Ig domain-containing protein, partial [Rubrivivax sp.]